MPLYRVHHHTRYRYSAPISQSMMEVRMQPRDDANQHCLSFRLRIQPRTQARSFVDHLGNTVHFFDLPRQHAQLVLRAESEVEVHPPPPLPDRLPTAAWETVDRLAESTDLFEWLQPSHFAAPSALLDAFAREQVLGRRDDPLTLVREINGAIYDAFEYMPASTVVDSPIDVALEQRQGVCQDYAHVMTALLRNLGIPCRYVSGYLFHRADQSDRSAEDASHAWVEAYLPDLGWIGFDPTNNLVVEDRHVCVAVGRDYADVPPTKGTFRGVAESELEVGVQVMAVERPQPEKVLLPNTGWTPPEPGDEAREEQATAQQQ